MGKGSANDLEMVCEVIDSMCLDMDDYLVHEIESSCDSAY